MAFYALIKHIHMACAAITLLGFILRGYWMLMDSNWLHKKAVKVLPHIVDTVLLVSAIIMVVQSGMYPFKVDFITLKVFLLIAYILIGTVALKRGKSKKIRVIAFVVALACILSIYAVAAIKPVLF